MSRPKEVTQEMKDSYVDAVGITLDGEPAYIRGRLLAYAVVCTLDGGYAEFSWQTVKHVMCCENGKFKR